MVISKNKEDISLQLKRVKIFSDFDQNFFDIFIPHLQIKEWKQGHSIIIEGDVGENMFFVLRGRVRIIKKTLSKEEYTVAILKDEQGIFFGEVGLLTKDERSATVKAENDCLLAELDHTRFNDFLKKYPNYGVEFLKRLSVSICQKLKKSNQDTLTLYQALVHEIGESYL
ncbi:MAG: cyclic nucleotide-binding domain-containing protein [Oligoflexia bacterium]|nr:cyclic nucleotide-binding domain-containing protein [Oligoflexia bacterium]